MTGRAFTVFLLVIVAVFSRLIPHPWNLTAVGSVALFAGAHLRPKILAYAVPILAFFISDLILGVHSTMFFTYGAVVISSALGVRYLQNPRPLLILGLSLSSSLIFFVISNLGVWLVGGLYPMTMQGLVNCFVMAVPFFQGQVLGDLLHSAVLFGSYAILVKRNSVPSPNL